MFPSIAVLLFSQDATADTASGKEIIEAIGSLWLLVLTIVVGCALIYFRVEIRALLKELLRRKFRYKHGEHEVELGPPPSDVPEEPPASPEQEREPPPPPEEPTPTTTKPTTEDEPSRLLFNMFIAFEARDFEKAEQAYARMKDSDRETKERINDEAFYLFLRFKHKQDTESLAQLEKLAADNPKSNAYSLVGSCYSFSGDYSRAAEAYETSAQHATDQKGRILGLTSASKALFRAGKKERAFSLLMNELSKDESSELYEGLAELFQMNGDHELRALALEKALEQKPNDKGILFSAAYSFGEAKQGRLALLHYKTLLDFSPDAAISLNNLGVQYQEQDMHILSVSSYDKAAELGETLAMANLAYKYMNAGFLGHASAILSKAMSKEDVHPNVGSALAALSKKQEDEKSQEQGFLESAREQRRFNSEFAQAYFVASAGGSQFAGDWKVNEKRHLTVTVSGSRMTATWKFTGKLVSALSADNVEKFEGEIQNRGVRVDIMKLEPKWDFVQGKTIEEWVKKGSGLGFVSPDGPELRFILFRSSDAPSYLRFKKINQASPE